MDIQGKPRMSRELVQRLSKHGVSTNAQPLGHAVDSAPHVSMDARQRVYRRSHLASQPAVRRVGAEMGVPQRRESHKEPQGGNDTTSQQRLDTGMNRPSAGFQEPKGRGYNPFA